jgi:hypothetical protein
MKKLIVTLALVAMMTPALASADTITTTTRNVSDSDMVDYNVRTQSVSESPFAGNYMMKTRETTTIKKFKPAPSDTDYTSNFVNPGTVETQTEVNEYTTIR